MAIEGVREDCRAVLPSWALALVLAVLAVGMGACGGDDEAAPVDGQQSAQEAVEGEGDEQGALTREQFDAEMDRLCGEAENAADAIEAEAEQLGEDIDPEQGLEGLSEAYARMLNETAIPRFEEVLSQFERVDPPPALASDYASFLQVSERQLELLSEQADAIEEDPEAVFETRDREQRMLVRQARELGESLGLPPACGTTGG